jgi:hypothetical protein
MGDAARETKQRSYAAGGQLCVRVLNCRQQRTCGTLNSVSSKACCTSCMDTRLDRLSHAA